MYANGILEYEELLVKSKNVIQILLFIQFEIFNPHIKYMKNLTLEFFMSKHYLLKIHDIKNLLLPKQYIFDEEVHLLYYLYLLKCQKLKFSHDLMKIMYVKKKIVV
jgi:hypothetical protein